jgi:secreted trypsin-like serine protease
VTLALATALGACGERAHEVKAPIKGPVIQSWKAGDPVGNPLASLADPASAPEGRRGLSPDVVGPEVESQDYPWQVGIRVETGGAGGGWRCGGILISPRFVLTAAHCLDAADYNDYSIVRRVAPQMVTVFHGDRVFGQGTSRAADPAWVPIIHPKWKTDQSKPFAFDVGLIRLQQPIANATLAPLQSAAINSGSGVVSGWGRFDSSNIPSQTLRAAAVPLIDNATCKAHLPANAKAYVTDVALCAESTTNDACAGDSGGPLVIGSRSAPQTIGVVSWGPSGHCTFRGPNNTMVGGYARAAAVVDWVRSSTGDPNTVTSAAPQRLMSVNPISGTGVDR